MTVPEILAFAEVLAERDGAEKSLLDLRAVITGSAGRDHGREGAVTKRDMTDALAEVVEAALKARPVDVAS